MPRKRHIGYAEWAGFCASVNALYVADTPPILTSSKHQPGVRTDRALNPKRYANFSQPFFYFIERCLPEVLGGQQFRLRMGDQFADCLDA